MSVPGVIFVLSQGPRLSSGRSETETLNLAGVQRLSSLRANEVSKCTQCSYKCPTLRASNTQAGPTFGKFTA